MLDGVRVCQRVVEDGQGRILSRQHPAQGQAHQQAQLFALGLARTAAYANVFGTNDLYERRS